MPEKKIGLNAKELLLNRVEHQHSLYFVAISVGMYSQIVNKVDQECNKSWKLISFL